MEPAGHRVGQPWFRTPNVTFICSCKTHCNEDRFFIITQTLLGEVSYSFGIANVISVLNLRVTFHTLFEC